MNLNRNYRYLFFIMLGIGIVGVVFFFPMKINSRYTCLYHRLFHPDYHSTMERQISDNSANSINGSDCPQSKMIAGNKSEINRADNSGINVNHSGPHTSEAQLNSSDLLDRYIHGYAWFWWGSILLLAYAFYIGKNRNGSRKKK